MCLDKITKKYGLPKKVTCYKVFKKGIYKDILHPLYMDKFEDYFIDKDIKISSVNINICISRSILNIFPMYNYTSGFHAYKKLVDAKHRAWCPNMVVYKVELSDLTAIGLQQGSIVVVGKKMKILKKVKIDYRW